MRFSSLSCVRSPELCRLARGDCSPNSNVNSRAGAAAQGKDVDREFEMKSKICGCFSVSLEQSTTGPIAKRAQRARLLLAGWEIEGGRYPVTANSNEKPRAKRQGRPGREFEGTRGEGQRGWGGWGCGLKLG
jgi:hypothetical protein